MRITIDIDEDGETTHTNYTFPPRMTPQQALHGISVAMVSLGRELVEARQFHGDKPTPEQQKFQDAFRVKR